MNTFRGFSEDFQRFSQRFSNIFRKFLNIFETSKPDITEDIPSFIIPFQSIFDFDWFWLQRCYEWLIVRSYYYLGQITVGQIRIMEPWYEMIDRHIAILLDSTRTSIHYDTKLQIHQQSWKTLSVACTHEGSNFLFSSAMIFHNNWREEK